MGLTAIFIPKADVFESEWRPLAVAERSMQYVEDLYYERTFLTQRRIKEHSLFMYMQIFQRSPTVVFNITDKWWSSVDILSKFIMLFT